MIESKTLNPFNPGYGGDPAYFAGREKVEFDILQTLKKITQPQDKEGKIKLDADAPIMLIGPRGVGKTVLLNRAKTKAKELGITTISIFKKQFNEDFVSLIKTLTRTNLGYIKEYLSDYEINLGGLGKVRPKNPDEIIELIMEANLKKGPVVLLCDEAHEYNLTDFGDFSSTIQYLIGESYPISVIYTGTPKLRDNITKMGASFTSRSNIKRLNTLKPDEAKAAIEFPFKENKITINEDAINYLVSCSDLFPYFTQIIGRHLWDLVVKNKLNKIELSLAENAVEESQELRNDYYLERKKELYASDNFNVLIDIIHHIHQNNEEIELFKLGEFVANKFNNDLRVSAVMELYGLGVIWDKNNRVVPGIPSFFNYILENPEIE